MVTGQWLISALRAHTHRTIADVAPTKIDSPNMACGPGAAASASQIANVTAGSTVEFGWRSGSPPTPWPHVRGPVLTYMGKCSGAASDCDAASMRWFKIDEQGFEADGVTWTQALYNQGKTTTATVPAALQNGNYLVRHEIVALHVLPAEFYISCIQVSVSGGSDAPTDVPDAFLATFPGGYSPQDPGVTADVFSQFKPADYQFPGPKLFFADSGNSTSTPASSSSSSSTTAPSSTASAPASTPTKVTCKTKKRALAGHRRRLPRNH